MSDSNATHTFSVFQHLKPKSAVFVYSVYLVYVNQLLLQVHLLFCKCFIFKELPDSHHDAAAI